MLTEMFQGTALNIIDPCDYYLGETQQRNNFSIKISKIKCVLTYIPYLQNFFYSCFEIYFVCLLKSIAKLRNHITRIE